MIASAVLCLAVVTTSACAGSGDPGATSSAVSTQATSASPSPTSTPTSPGRAARLERSLAKVAAAHPDADIAVGYAPVGTKGSARVVGSPQTLVAWSTIKVPLSLAVLRSGEGDAAMGDIDSALTASDSAAASRLWEGLGGGSAASTAVEAQLRRGGDRSTRVPAQVRVPGYSPFGQAKWRLSDQTGFTAALPCLDGSRPALAAMDRVVDGQRWGLGGIDGARFKGGWGSTPQGYVVRQLGIVPGTKGASAVTLQVRTGTHEQGTAIADELVRAIRTHRDQLPVGVCG